MMNWLKVMLFWRRLDPANPPGGPVMVHWRQATGAAKVRIAVWKGGRFVDWFGGIALVDHASASGPLYWRRLPLR